MNYPIIHKNENITVYDINPKLVGQEGLIDEVSEIQGKMNYAIAGISGKYAWYNEEQLEMVSKNPNN